MAKISPMLTYSLAPRHAVAFKQVTFFSLKNKKRSCEAWRSFAVVQLMIIFRKHPPHQGSCVSEVRTCVVAVVAGLVGGISQPGTGRGDGGMRTVLEDAACKWLGPTRGEGKKKKRR